MGDQPDWILMTLVIVILYLTHLFSMKEDSLSEREVGGKRYCFMYLVWKSKNTMGLLSIY